MKTEVFKNESTSVEVGRFETATGPRLMIRNLTSGAEIYLDPFELEGLARAAQEPPEPPSVRSEVYRNEFAMVEVGRFETQAGSRLMVRDSASGAEVYLEPAELEKLTLIRHGYFAPFLDPSELVAEGEPDPDQV